MLVTGGRHYSDGARVWAVLNEIHRSSDGPITVIIHGDAYGADSLGKAWAERHHVLDDPWPADWAKYGKAAGVIRNSKMLEGSKPDIVVAFPGNTGTADMVAKAEKAGVRVRRVPA